MTGTTVAKREAVQELVAVLDRPDYRRQLADMLPPKVSLDTFVRHGKLAIQRQPELLDADRASLFLALVQGAASGLLPDGRESVLVVQKVKGKDTVQWRSMIGGIRKIAAEHGITLAASVIHANDTFTYSKMPPRLEHSPTALGAEKGDVLGAYAVALDDTGRIICPPVVMDVVEIERVRATSRSATGEYSPWVKWWDRMACKTVARRLFTEMPLADQAREQIERAVADVDTGEVVEASAEVPALANLPEIDPAADDGEVVEAEIVNEGGQTVIA
ncbi:MAG: recombinase RecT [Deltaproteobacteria bacterium]|nr:recombinase RecT [Deltaproteobacteria bacterium]